MKPLEETLKTNEEMKHLSKEMQALLILPKYLLPNANSKVINTISECVLKYEKEHKALEIIKKLNPYTIVEVQGQWYLMIGDIFVKAPKIPITEEEAILLKEILK